MRVLFISDILFTRHEREMLARLAVGLADEGLNVAWGVPREIAGGLNEQVLLPVIPFTEKRLGLTPARRASSLLARARVVLGGDPDIVHFFGGGVFRIGAELARLARGVPAFEIWRPGVESAVRVAINRVYGTGAPATDRGGASALVVTPSDALRDRMSSQFPDSVVRTIPWGVYPVSDPPARDGGTLCMLLLGPGRDQRSWQAAFRASVSALKTSERLHLFADSETTRRLRLWPVARQAGVLDRLSLIDEAATRRDLTLRVDVLLQPDARGELRTILLDAMAARVAVLAAADPRSEILVDGKTARLVVDGTDQQWYEAIEMVIHDSSMRKKLTESARAFVRDKHKASRQIISLVDAYEWVAGEATQIEASGVLGQNEL